MKKRYIRKRNVRKNKLIWSLFVSLCVVLIFTFVNVTNHLAINKSREEYQKIVINPELAVEGKSYELPKEATNLYEEKLKEKFKNYVQTFSKVSVIEKLNFESFSLNGNTTISDVKKTEDGNFILVIATRNDNEVWNNSIYIFNSYLVKVTPKGEIINLLNIATQETKIVQSTNSLTDYSNALDASEIFEKNGRYSVFYQGYTPMDKTNSWSKRMIGFDQFLGNVTYTDVQVTESGSFTGNTYHQNREKEVLNLGYLSFFNQTDVKTDGQFPIEKRDLLTGEVVERKWVTFPAFSKLNSLAELYQDGWGACLNLSLLERTKDGGYIGYGFANVPDAVGSKFIKTTDYIIKWSASGEYQWYESTEPDGRLVVQEDLNDATKMVVLKVSPKEENSKLVAYDLTTSRKKEEVLKEFPPKSNVKLSYNVNEEFGTMYDYFGYLPIMTGEFAGYPNGPGMVVGSLKEDYTVSGANFLTSDAYISINQLIPISETDNFFVYGATYSKTFSKPPLLTGWSEKRPYINGEDSFFGSMKKVEDYAPAISATDNIIVDLDDADLKKEQEMNKQEILDNWLINGSKNASMTSKKAIQVTDTYDLNPEYSQLTQAELHQKINRNPLDNNLPIDWKSLGFNWDKRGSQKVTYFITDTNKQTTATTRIINKVDDETIYEQNVALAATNFTIHVNALESELKNEMMAKQLAQLVAWNTINGIKIDDGTIENGVVKVNKQELKKIQEVQKAYQNTKNPENLIKPYPLTFTIDFKGRQLKRTITVFVLNDTTIVDEKNETVLYGFNFKSSIKKVAQLSSKEVVDLSKASAWHLKMNRDKNEVSSYPITDIYANVSDPPNDEYTGLNHVTKIGDYKVKLTYKETNNNQIIAHVFGQPMTLHVRQVIVNPQESIVIPTQGFLFIHNIKEQAASSVAVKNSQIPSGLETGKQRYQKIQVDSVYNHWWYRIEPVIPQHYQYEGHVLTSDMLTHDIKDKSGETIYIDTTEEDEYWLTLYFSPVYENALLSNWDYIRIQSDLVMDKDK